MFWLLVSLFWLLQGTKVRKRLDVVKMNGLKIVYRRSENFLPAFFPASRLGGKKREAGRVSRRGPPPLKNGL